ncbi:MAG: hypothetical protein MI975_27090 [Cytophagales bacterium]|nr:hypothetical protein [Cytophagales bacterium]
MRWRQINTGTARVIYPTGMDSQAQRVANIVHHIRDHGHGSVGNRHKKIDIVLQNQTVASNGYVGLAPFRSEYYLNPPQSGYLVSSNWLDILTIHEQRHVQQFSNARRGLTNFGYVIGGELGWSFFSSLSIPNWFWEGDAVVFETALSKQGRGRMPSFYNGFKSLYLEDTYYVYNKVRNGSLKDFVPNHYESGYLMVNYGREEFGFDFWKDVLHQSGKYKGLFYPFSRSIYRKTGNPSYDFYIMALRHYNSKWDDVKKKPEQEGLEQLNDVDKGDTYTVYRYPYFDREGSAIVYKSSYKRIGGFYRINQYGMEYLITRQGRVLDSYFSYKNGKLVWAEIGQDERWSWGVNSNIVLYDMSGNEKRKLTSSSKYFSPDLSHDGERIVVFQSTPELKYNLHIISAEDGKLLREIPNASNYYFSYPKWSPDDREIVSIARDNLGRNALVKVDTATGGIEKLTEFTDHQLGIPWQTKDRIYFSATFSGIDNIYALKNGNDTIFQVTDERIGAYNASINPADEKLYYTDFNKLGSDIKRIPVDTLKWKPITIKEPVDMPEYDFVSNSGEGGDITGILDNKEYASTKYSNSAKLINLHSWSLFFIDPNYEWALRSNNILNTLDMSLGIRYNRNDDDLTYFFDAAYAQLYPVLTFSASTGKRAGLRIERNAVGFPTDTVKVEWWEDKLKTGFLLPFDISKGLYTSKLNLFSNYAVTAIRFKNNESVETTNFNLSSVETGASFLNRRKKARQNIFSKNSQYIQLIYNGSIDENKAGQLLIDSEWTFPGFSDNHNIVFQASYQHEDAENDYRFTDNFVYSRGYNRPVYDYLYKIGSNYHLPVVYPDWGFWGMLYFYRIRANAFFDYSRAHLINSETNTKSIQLYNSVGGEIVFDTNIFNLYQMSLGFRYSYLLNEDPRERNLKHSFEVFIPLLRF